MTIQDLLQATLLRRLAWLRDVIASCPHDERRLRLQSLRHTALSQLAAIPCLPQGAA